MGKIFLINLCHSSVKYCSNLYIDTQDAIRSISFWNIRSSVPLRFRFRWFQVAASSATLNPFPPGCYLSGRVVVRNFSRWGPPYREGCYRRTATRIIYNLKDAIHNPCCHLSTISGRRVLDHLLRNRLGKLLILDRFSPWRSSHQLQGNKGGYKDNIPNYQIPHPCPPLPPSTNYPPSQHWSFFHQWTSYHGETAMEKQTSNPNYIVG